ncbi:MAG TPA: hypothetical protein VD968_02040 [Pyrinomonadaceae bacterium]|nr:hypothetical protein [Pyrinomonadaceae bacterium]
MRSASVSLLLCAALLAAGARRAECRQSGAQAQPAQAAKADDAAEKVRRKVEKIRIGGRITVKTKDGKKFHGAVRSIGETGFDIVEVDLHQVVTFDYADVKKAQSGYGEKNLFGQRPDPKRTAIVGAAALVGLLTLIVLSIPRT